LFSRLSHNGGDSLPNEQYLLLCQYRAVRNKGGLALCVFQHGPTWQTAQMLQILRGINRFNARAIQGLAHVELSDMTVCIGRAQHAYVQLVGPVDIVCVLTTTGDQARILSARHTLTNSKFHEKFCSKFRPVFSPPS
jgi:hypothetical protein